MEIYKLLAQSAAIIQSIMENFDVARDTCYKKRAKNFERIGSLIPDKVEMKESNVIAIKYSKSHATSYDITLTPATANEVRLGSRHFMNHPVMVESAKPGCTPHIIPPNRMVLNTRSFNHLSSKGH